MKHLLVVTPEFEPTSGGGIVTFYGQLLRPLRASGLRVTVLVGSAFSQPGGKHVIDGIEVHGLDSERFATRLAQFGHCAGMPELARHLAAAWALHDMASELAPDADVVEATDWGLLFVPWVVEPDRALVVRCHGSCAQIAWHEREGAPSLLGSLLDAVEADCLADAHGICTYAPANAEYWRARLGRDVEFIPPAQPLLEPAVGGGSDWLVLARVQRWKGPHVLSRALQALPDSVRVTWIGRDVPDGASEGISTLSSLQSSFPDEWQRRVTHRNTVSAAEARALVRYALGVLVPSTWDVFNFTVAEAMASGALVVASTGAGASFLVEDGVNGYAFEARDAAALAEAIRRASGLDADARRRLGDAARERVRSLLDPVRVAMSNLDMYRRTEPPRRRGVESGLRQLLRPSRIGAAHAMAETLAALPLRMIGSHVGARLRRKVSRKE